MYQQTAAARSAQQLRFFRKICQSSSVLCSISLVRFNVPISISAHQLNNVTQVSVFSDIVCVRTPKRFGFVGVTCSEF
jgi:hypothetical protein